MKNNVKLISLCLGLASLALGQTTTAPIYQMSILAGIPTPNSLGDNGPSTFASVSDPTGIALDKSGNIFVADQNNNRIRRIDAVTGVITTYASTGINAPVSLAFDNEGNLWVSQTGNSGQILRLTTPAAGSALATTCTLSATGATGTCVMSSNQSVASVYGGDGQYAYNAWFNSIGQLAIDNNDDVFVTDTSDNRVRMIKNTNNCMYTPITTGNMTITNTCIITTIAGAANGTTAGTPQFGTNCSTTAAATGVVTNLSCTPAGTNTVGDGGPALAARISGPTGVAVSPDGTTVYVAETGDQRIRVINMTNGIINTVIGNCTQGTAVVVGQNNANKTSPTVIPCPSGSFGSATAAGQAAGVSSLGDGKAASQATVNKPQGLFLDPVGNVLWFADNGNGLIRYINLNTGIVNTAVGSNTITSATGDAGLLTNLTLTNPNAVWVQNGLIYWVEAQATDKVRIADPLANVAKTLTRVPRSSGSGGPATNAYLGFSTSFTSSGSPRVGVDNAGNVYVIEASTNRIRQVNAQGVINDWAGTGAAAGTGKTNGDTGPAVVAQLSAPQAVAFDSNGNGYIADTGINRIRMVNSSGVISTVIGRNQVTSCTVINAGNGSCTIDKSNYVGDGGPPSAAILSSPQGVAVDSQNNLIIADTGHQAIRYANLTTNVMTTIGGGVPAFDPATGGPFPGGPTDGRSGLGTSGYNDSTDAVYGLLKDPRGVAVDKNGNIYISDFSNNAARELVPVNINKLAYSMISFYGANSSSGTAPKIPTTTAAGAASVPGQIRITSGNNTSVAVDTGGNIYFALPNDNRVNVVSADHTKVFEVAGGGTNDVGLNYTATNGLNLEVPQVTGVAVDASGNVYTADHTGLVRKLVCTKNCLPLK